MDLAQLQIFEAVVEEGGILKAARKLDVFHGAQVKRHAIPRALSTIVTPLVWRRREESAALVALEEELMRSVVGRAAASSMSTS